MRCPYCDGKGYIEVLVQQGCAKDRFIDLDVDREICEDCNGAGIASAYTASVMGAAKAAYETDKPYLRMAREQGVKVETMADCELFKEEVTT